MTEKIRNVLYPYIKEHAGLGSVRELVGRAIGHSGGAGLPNDPEELKDCLNSAVDYASLLQTGTCSGRYSDRTILGEAMRSVRLDAPGVMLALAMNTDIPHFLLPVREYSIKDRLSWAVDIAVSRRTA